jgi:seryl-tRNA synthetase
MIEVLRAEEQDDVEHRDRCQRSENKNGNNMEDLNGDIQKKANELSRMADEEKATGEKVTSLEEAIEQTKKDLAELLKLRNTDHDDFKKSLKDDTDAVKLLEQAITSLAGFYKRNKIPLSLEQHTDDPKYTVDPDKAPETSWAGSEYGGRKSESQGIIAILTMLKADVQRQMDISRKDDAASQATYTKDSKALKKTLDAQEKSKTAAERELSDLQGAIEETKRQKAESEKDLGVEGKMKDALATDCSWVESHFDSRREKRKAEMDGLVEAKNYLAGVEAGDDLPR